MTMRVKGEVFIFLVIQAKNNLVSDMSLLEAAGTILTYDAGMLGISLF